MDFIQSGMLKDLEECSQKLNQKLAIRVKKTWQIPLVQCFYLHKVAGDVGIGNDFLCPGS